jgi:hypothetical protein
MPPNAFRRHYGLRNTFGKIEKFELIRFSYAQFTQNNAKTHPVGLLTSVSMCSKDTLIKIDVRGSVLRSERTGMAVRFDKDYRMMPLVGAKAA